MTVLHVLTGQEMELFRRLEEFRPLLPIEDSLMRRHGAWRPELRVLMPGYLFLDKNLSVAEYYRAAETPGVIRVMNFDDPLPEDEANMIRRLAGGVLAPHVIDAAGNVVQGFFRTKDLVKAHKRQCRAVFAATLMGRRQEISVSATFL